MKRGARAFRAGLLETLRRILFGLKTETPQRVADKAQGLNHPQDDGGQEAERYDGRDHGQFGCEFHRKLSFPIGGLPVAEPTELKGWARPLPSRFLVAPHNGDGPQDEFNNVRDGLGFTDFNNYFFPGFRPLVRVSGEGPGIRWRAKGPGYGDDLWTIVSEKSCRGCRIVRFTRRRARSPLGICGAGSHRIHRRPDRAARRSPQNHVARRSEARLR